MESNKEDSFRAKEIAERRFTKKDFIGARKYAFKAQKLYPEMEGISQMLATFDVYVASTVQIDGEIDFYSVLGLNPLANEETIKKHFKKLALILHPDKNKTVGADGAFKLVSEAWALLSDSNKRVAYDLRRSKTILTQASNPAYYTVQTPVYDCSSTCSKPLNLHNLPKSATFWTICSSCKVQYEYLRKYVNMRLSCKNCRKTFLASEIETPPLNGSVHLRSCPVYQEYGHGNQVTYLPADTVFVTGNGVPGFHPDFTSEYQNISFQYSTVPGSSARVIGNHRSVVTSCDVHKARERGKGRSEKVKTLTKGIDTISNVASTKSFKSTKPPVSKVQRPEKRRKVDENYVSRNGYAELVPKSTREVKMANGDGTVGAVTKQKRVNELPNRHFSMAPAFDARQIFIDKARKVIREKLEEMKLAAAEEKAKAQNEVCKSEEIRTRTDLFLSVDEAKPTEPRSISIVVPDSDFHDFDMERSEECFKPKQIWALYDEEDGMPRLYCIIRQIISAKPFKIRISHLNSKTDSEFGSKTKSCGYFRAGNSDVIDRVNIFSHIICGEKKAGKGGVLQIFPKKGDIWAMYRNWSPDRNPRNEEECMKNEYEMVEVLDDFTEKLGVCVKPLVKVNGYRTVYQTKTEKNSIRWIPTKEMLRFSHQVPSWVIKGEAKLPDGCCDLDPAATPEDLLQAITEAKN